MSSPKKPNRHYLLCPVCLKTNESLSVHLRRVCMKNATPEAINAAVEKAKKEAHELLRSGRMFNYGRLCQIMADANPLKRMIEELQRHQLVVTDIPPTLPDPVPGPSTTQQPQSAEPEDSESSSDIASVSSGETFQCVPDVEWKRKNRKLMADKGLYQKHSLDHPLLKDFATYLEKELCNENFKQEVENVSRYLYYVDPQTPSLRFVMEREKLRVYMSELSDAKLSKQTQLNYLKSLKRFLYFHTVNTSLSCDDVELHAECKRFMEFIGLRQKVCSKQVSKEITQRRHSLLTAPESLTPADCWTVLKVAKKDFLAVIGKVFEDKNAVLVMAECSFVVYYLEAVVILRHLQRPGVVEHMTVKEWVLRITDTHGNAIIGVKEHKTAAQYVATFALTQEEEMWFDTYYTRVRPQLLNSKKRKRDDTEEQERFFISTTGMPIYNASNDLNRLHSKYNLKPVTSQTARRVFETATKTLTEVEKSLVADYLSHSSSTAEKHYRMKQAGNVGLASNLLAKIGGDSGAESAGEGTSAGRGRVRGAAHAVPGNVQIDVQAAYSRLVESHPVTLDGVVPSKVERKKYSADDQRVLYERWLKAQMKLRKQHVLAYFSRRLPAESRVSSWLNKQGWKSNIPSAASIVKEWKPSGSEDTVMDSSRIRKMTRTQKWKGLLVTDVEGKGKGVVATRRFQVGEVICDYHGRAITAKEGKDIHVNTSEEETGYMFFYKDKRGRCMCMDAHTEHCECHPEMQTVGRHINHAGEGVNLKTRLYTVDTDGEEQDVILFIASKPIEVNDELLFDYGVNKSSFGGEGEDLAWLS